MEVPLFINGKIRPRNNSFFGKNRRTFIKKIFLENPGALLGINGMHQIPLKRDPELKRLIKDGFLRVLEWGPDTYLTMN